MALRTDTAFRSGRHTASGLPELPPGGHGWRYTFLIQKTAGGMQNRGIKPFGIQILNRNPVVIALQHSKDHLVTVNMFFRVPLNLLSLGLFAKWIIAQRS